MSRAAHLARIRRAHHRAVATGRQHKAALDAFVEAVLDGRDDGVTIPQAAAEIGLHENTLRQKIREAAARQAKREAPR